MNVEICLDSILREACGSLQPMPYLLHCLYMLCCALQRLVWLPHVDIHPQSIIRFLCNHNIGLPTLIVCWVDILNLVVISQDLQVITQSILICKWNSSKGFCNWLDCWVYVKFYILEVRFQKTWVRVC